MPLSQAQEQALSDHLSRNQLRCVCGKSDWEFGDKQLPIADLDVTGRTLQPSREFVEVTCRSCGHAEAVDCEKAGIPPV